MKFNVKVYKEQGAVLPIKAHDDDAGMDVTAYTKEDKGDQIVYGTGLYFQLPPKSVMKIYPRSSIYKTNLQLANSVGILDSNYRGELKLIFNKVNPKRSIRNLFGLLSTSKPSYEIGDRIGQIIIEPVHIVNMSEVEYADDLNYTERGSGGFGSTGN